MHDQATTPDTTPDTVTDDDGVRKHIISVRLNPSEYAILDRLAPDSPGLRGVKARYIRRLIAGQPPGNVPVLRFCADVFPGTWARFGTGGPPICQLPPGHQPLPHWSRDPDTGDVRMWDGDGFGYVLTPPAAAEMSTGLAATAGATR